MTSESTLSEKAKGKRRAIDPPPSPPIPQSPTRDLTIRFTEGIPDVRLPITPSQSIRDVKSAIRNLRPQLRERRLRLIHSGRLLTDGVVLEAWLRALEERQARAGIDSVGDKAKGNANMKGKGREISENNMWVHCSVGPQMNVGEVEAEQTAQIQPLRGFDRLTAAGFSESDIANFRRQFHSSNSESTTEYLDAIEFSTDEEYDEHYRALEEQWIDSLDTPSSALLSQSPSPSSSLFPNSSNTSSMLQGIIVGFFFPLLPFFFMREPKAAIFWDTGGDLEDDSDGVTVGSVGSVGSVVFSRKMQVGLVVGFLVNLLFGMWRVLLDTA